MTDPVATARARADGRRARRALGAAVRDRANTAIVERLLALGELGAGSSSVGSTARAVALYVPVDGEVDVTAAAAPLRRRGWTTLLPVVETDTSMRFLEWSPEDELAPGTYGILEPPRDGRSTVDGSMVSVVVAPCTAVDSEGTRVGFGGGFYDRALSGAGPRPIVVVVAFEVQLCTSRLDRRAWDVPADVVVTERRAIRVGRRVDPDGDASGRA